MSEASHPSHRVRIYLIGGATVDVGRPSQAEAELVCGQMGQSVRAGDLININDPEKITCISGRHVLYMVAEPWP